MNRLKIFEIVGVILMVISFILYIANDQGYLKSFSNLIEYSGLIGLATWSIAFGLRKSKNEEK